MGLIGRIRTSITGGKEEELKRFQCRTCYETFELPASEAENARCEKCGSENVRAA